MLIYNFQKEFLGIDEKDLKTFGFNSLEELRREVRDFADLFIKTPGYIHNFQHIHWIDFVQYSDDAQTAKVLININSKTFSANLKITTLYLIDNPSVPAYMIYLQNLHPLSQDESDNLANEIFEHELPKVKPAEQKTFTTPTPTPASTQSPMNMAESIKENQQNNQSFESTPLEIDFSEPDVIQSPQKQETLQEQKQTTEAVLDINDLSLDVFDDEPLKAKEEPSTQKEEISTEEELTNAYQYDPYIASKELGLPIDLIEEFIQDFIAQAKEFHDEIYLAIQQNDIEKVKALSHKLKGVAANLRIEDAHEVLATVSANSEMPVIHESLDLFYKIVAKLSGEPQSQSSIDNTAENEQKLIEPISLEFKDETTEMIEISENELANDENTTDTQDDDFKLDFKEDAIKIEDADVPDKIDIPELADDDFFEEIEINNEIAQSDTQSLSYSKISAAKEIGIDQESFNELLNDFVKEGHIIFQNITAAVQNDNLENCRNEAIKFKRMSDNMRLHEFDNELETLIYSSDKESILQAAQKIDTHINNILEAGA